MQAHVPVIPRRIVDVDEPREGVRFIQGKAEWLTFASRQAA